MNTDTMIVPVSIPRIRHCNAKFKLSSCPFLAGYLWTRISLRCLRLFQGIFLDLKRATRSSSARRFILSWQCPLPPSQPEEARAQAAESGLGVTVGYQSLHHWQGSQYACNTKCACYTQYACHIMKFVMSWWYWVILHDTEINIALNTCNVILNITHVTCNITSNTCNI